MVVTDHPPHGGAAMPDHYRTLIQSLMQLGFLFSRLGERKQEVWRNRQTDQEVMFDRHEVSGSREAAEAAVKRAKSAKPGVKATGPAAPNLGRLIDLSARAAPPARAKAAKPAGKPAAKPKVASKAKGKASAAKQGPRRRAR